MFGKIRGQNNSDGKKIKKTIANILTKLGVPTQDTATMDEISDNISELASNKYSSGYTKGNSDGYSAGTEYGKESVTISTSISGRTVTATASNGKSVSSSIPYGTNNGNHNLDFELNGDTQSATMQLSSGYYSSGYIQIDASDVYADGYSNGKEDGIASVGVDNITTYQSFDTTGKYGIYAKLSAGFSYTLDPGKYIISLTYTNSTDGTYAVLTFNNKMTELYIIEHYQPRNYKVSQKLYYVDDTNNIELNATSTGSWAYGFIELHIIRIDSCS